MEGLSDRERRSLDILSMKKVARLIYVVGVEVTCGYNVVETGRLDILSVDLKTSETVNE